MSEWFVRVVEINNISKHPNADALSIVNVDGGYPCIVKLDQFKIGDKAVYIPIDSIVPLDNPLFSFLTDNEFKKTKRIKAKKLRNIFSMGLLIAAESDMNVGDIVHERYGITKYDPEVAITMQGESESPPSFMPEYTDIEGFRKHKNIFMVGEPVCITEKIHGSSARFLFKEGRLWVGSHHQVKKEDPNNLFWKAANQYQLKAVLNNFPERILYGEVYGPVQKGYNYDVASGKVGLRIFDIFYLPENRFLNWQEVKFLCNLMSLPTVPILYEGPWSDDLTEMRNGQSTIGQHTREGFVIKPRQEAFDPRIGRKILKFVGENYLLNKNS